MTVFVHAWFRSSSTWFWTKLRNDNRFVGFYEPLNEEIPVWIPQMLKRTGTRSFEGDKHPALERPYFYEYRDLIASGQLHFDKSNSFERYFLDPAENDDRLNDYLSRLVSEAENTGLQPALCFCRSQMRSLWMKKNFDAVHIAQIRNPWDQWVSFGKHSFFKKTVLLTAFCLEKRHPGSFSHVSGINHLVTAWTNQQQIGFRDIDCFCAYITIWIASTIQAIVASDIIFDVDLMGARGQVISELEAKLEAHCLPSDLSDFRSTSRQSALQR